MVERPFAQQAIRVPQLTSMVQTATSSVWRAPQGFVDGEGWARWKTGYPITRVDGCGQLESNAMPNATVDFEHTQGAATTLVSSSGANSSAPTDLAEGESSSDSGSSSKGLMNRRARGAARTIVVHEPLGVVTSKYSYKFFHWLVEGLPRVALLMAHDPLLWGLPGKNGERDGSDHGRRSSASNASWTRHAGDNGTSGSHAKLLVSCKAPWVRHSLALLGFDVRVHAQRVQAQRVPRGGILCFRSGRVYRTTTFLLWPTPSPCGGAHARPVNLLRRRVLPPSLRPIDSAANVYAEGAIIVHARAGRTRRLTNHDALLETMRAHGVFATAVLPLSGNGTLREQVEIFRGARCQVGPHGVCTSPLPHA